LFFKFFFQFLSGWNILKSWFANPWFLEFWVVLILQFFLMVLEILCKRICNFIPSFQKWYTHYAQSCHGNSLFYPPRNVKKFILVQKTILAQFFMDIYYNKFVFQFGCSLCQFTNKDHGLILNGKTNEFGLP